MECCLWLSKDLFLLGAMLINLKIQITVSKRLQACGICECGWILNRNTCIEFLLFLISSGLCFNVFSSICCCYSFGFLCNLYPLPLRLPTVIAVPCCNPCIIKYIWILCPGLLYPRLWFIGPLLGFTIRELHRCIWRTLLHFLKLPGITSLIGMSR